MSKSNLNLLDRAISYINPKMAYERVSWRQSLQMNYDSGSFSSRNRGWNAVNAPAEQTSQGSRDVVRARARDLERNSDIAEAIVGNIERNTVGTGIKLQAKILKPDNKEENEDLNIQFENIWNDWCLFNCDITGRQTFREMCKMAVRRKRVDGGIFFVKSFVSGRKYPFVLQPREVDDLDSSLQTISSDGNRVINGIEVDQYNKPVAYWFKTVTPDGLWVKSSERITADRVIFLFDIKRSTQVREMSQLAQTANRVRDINETVEAYSIKEYIQACFSIFIKKQNPSSSFARPNPGPNNPGAEAKTGYKFTKVTPGMVEQLEPGDDVITANPTGQAGNLREFVVTQQRLAGSGQGLSYESTSRDMSMVNYSSARQGLLQDMLTYGDEQLYLEEHLCREVYRTLIISCWLAGMINIKDFWQNLENYLRHVWIAPGQKWIDPLKEAKANEMGLASGQMTLEDICAAQGKDWREVLKQRAKEEEYARSLGLNLIIGNSGDTVIIDDSENKPGGKNK